MADDFGNGDSMDLPVGPAAVNRLIQENSDLFSDSHCKVCSAILISESQKLAHYQSKKHANKYRQYKTIHQDDDVSPAKKMKIDESIPQLQQQKVIDEGDRNKCCPICNMTFSSPVVAASHYEGKTHSKNLKMKEQGGVPQGVPRVPKPAAAAAAPPRLPPGTPDKSDPQKFCQLCSATFNNPQMAEQHYKGKKHKKQETKSELMTIYTSSGNKLPQTTPFNPLTPGSGATGKWYNCDTCNIVLNSIEQYQAHVSGSKHKDNLKGIAPTKQWNRPKAAAEPGKWYNCDTCNIVLNSIEQYQAHVSGSKHKDTNCADPEKKVILIRDERAQKCLDACYSGRAFCNAREIVSNNDPIKVNGRFEHFSSLKGIAITKQLDVPKAAAEPGKWYNCDTCNIVLNSIEQYQAHVSGSKHNDNLKGIAPTKQWDRPKAADDRTSFGSFLSSSRLLPSRAPSTMSRFSSRLLPPKAPSTMSRFSSRLLPLKATSTMSGFSSRLLPPKAPSAMSGFSSRLLPPKAPSAMSGFSSRLLPPQAASTMSGFSSYSDELSSSGFSSYSDGPSSSGFSSYSDGPSSFDFSSYSDGLSSSVGYSSMTENYSSSYDLSSSGNSGSCERLLPLPSYAPQNQQHFPNEMRPDSYNYFNQGY